MDSWKLSEPAVQLGDWLEALKERQVKFERRDLMEALRLAQQEGNAAQSKLILSQFPNLTSAGRRVKSTSENV